MAKKEITPAATEFPAGEGLAQLKGLLAERDAPKRAQAVWQVLLQAMPNTDFPVVVDFALENNLIQSLDGTSSQLANGQRAQSIVWPNPIDGSEMIWIPPGPFCIGTEKVMTECAGFSLARYPVTNAQFARFLEATQYQPPEGHADPELFLHHWTKDGKPPKGKEKHPVVFVSYIDALHYCRWAGLHLPTEWQWEKAARGPDGRPFPWGTELPQPRQVHLANLRSNGTCAVGQYPRIRTPYGCEDLIGNVSEWCHLGSKDAYGFIPAPLPTEGSVLENMDGYSGVRGSCFLRRDTKLMHSAHQRRLAKIRRNYWTSFRPAFLQPWCPGIT